MSLPTKNINMNISTPHTYTTRKNAIILYTSPDTLQIMQSLTFSFPVRCYLVSYIHQNTSTHTGLAKGRNNSPLMPALVLHYPLTILLKSLPSFVNSFLTLLSVPPDSCQDANSPMSC